MLYSLIGRLGAQGVVKRFFNEKEVTSTLVMDALFSGCKQLEEASRLAESKKVRPGGFASAALEALQVLQGAVF